jgi:hypothetical protein
VGKEMLFMTDRYSAKVPIHIDLYGYKDLSVPPQQDEDAPPDDRFRVKVSADDVILEREDT